MTLEDIIKKIIEAKTAAIMIIEEKENNICSSIWGRMDKEQFYDVLEDAVAQHKAEKEKAFNKAWDEIKGRLPF